MNKLKTKVKINHKNCKKIEEAEIESLLETTSLLKTEIVNQQVVPFDTGDLQNSMFVDDTKANEGIASLVASTPYARRLYFHPEYNFNKGKNQNAQGKWFQPWIDGSEKDFVKDTFSKLLKDKGGI